MLKYKPSNQQGKMGGWEWRVKNHWYVWSGRHPDVELGSASIKCTWFWQVRQSASRLPLLQTCQNEVVLMGRRPQGLPYMHIFFWQRGSNSFSFKRCQPKNWFLVASESTGRKKNNKAQRPMSGFGILGLKIWGRGNWTLLADTRAGQFRFFPARITGSVVGM